MAELSSELRAGANSMTGGKQVKNVNQLLHVHKCDYTHK